MAESFLERVWKAREESVYHSIFGDLGAGIYPVASSLFTELFQSDFDPRWLFIGVFACPPSQGRECWSYASSGLSNPWESDDRPEDLAHGSGLGVEYLLQTTRPGDWAVELVQRVVAFDLLLAHGRYEGGAPLRDGDRIPYRGSIAREFDSVLDTIVIGPPRNVPHIFQLESGTVRFAQLAGISQAEAAYAKANGPESLIERLEEAGAYPVTDPARTSIC